jgi:hypothetical protein
LRRPINEVIIIDLEDETPTPTPDSLLPALGTWEPKEKTNYIYLYFQDPDAAASNDNIDHEMVTAGPSAADSSAINPSAANSSAADPSAVDLSIADSSAINPSAATDTTEEADATLAATLVASAIANRHRLRDRGYARRDRSE